MSAARNIFCLLIFLLCNHGSVNFNLFTEAMTFLPEYESSFAIYPPWNNCYQKSAFSFEFKTNRHKKIPHKVTLWYNDDIGLTDYVQVTLENGTIRMSTRLDDLYDSSTNVIVGKNLNDGNWHKVTYVRNRLEITMTVDEAVGKGLIDGSDMVFGQGKLSHVFIGGMNQSYHNHMELLSVPSILFLTPFKGEIRNIFYNNCTCGWERVRFITGVGIQEMPIETCDIRNPCRPGCLCISTDNEQPDCDCQSLHCTLGSDVKYYLPMDEVRMNRLVNSEGLDSVVYGVPVLGRGVNNSALELNGLENYLKVAGPSHRLECLGDLTLCSTGYTIAFWMNISHPISNGEHVYLSNGGHRGDNHGVSMSYNKGYLKLKFKNKYGREWNVGTNGILPGQWYHIAATWKANETLFLYVNGELVERSSKYNTVPAGDKTTFNDFVIGRVNDATGILAARKIWVDEFYFWNKFRNENEIREDGPIFLLKIPRDAHITIPGQQTPVEPGHIGNELLLNGKDLCIKVGEQGNSCFGDIHRCLYGVTAALWVKWPGNADKNGYVLDTGRKGLKVFVENGKLFAQAGSDDKVWKANWDQPLQNDQWYFIETTWSVKDGLSLYVDQKLAAESRNSVVEQSLIQYYTTSHLCVGRSGKDNPAGTYSDIVVDDIEFWNGDRDRLIKLDFISRDPPTKHVAYFGATGKSPSKTPTLKAEPFNSPRIVAHDQYPRFKGYLQLDGSNFVSLGTHGFTCLGNLDHCRHGMLMGAWIKPKRMESGMDYFSTGSNGIKMKVIENGQVEVVARTTSNEWTVNTDLIKPDKWQFVEVAWDRTTGLQLYVDNQLVSKSNNPIPRTTMDDVNPDRHRFYVGRGDGTRTRASYGVFDVGDMEYWYNSRDHLLAFKHLQRGRPESLKITMDKMEQHYLLHDKLNIRATGEPQVVQGRLDGAVHFDSVHQSLKADRLDDCFGDLNKCHHGFFGSFFLNRKHPDKTTYFSNGGGVTVQSLGENMKVMIENANKTWSVESPKLENNVWNFFEFTWHADKSLKLYINGTLVAENKSPKSAPNQDVQRGEFQIGTTAANAAQPDFMIDHLELWKSYRNYLTTFNYLLRGPVESNLFGFKEISKFKTQPLPNKHMQMHNGAQSVAGKFGKGILLAGNGEYVTFGDLKSTCLGDLQKCDHGLMMSFYFNPNITGKTEDAYYVSSGGYSFFSREDDFVARFQLPDRTWEVKTNKITPNVWQKVDISWQPDTGLHLYKDGVLIASNNKPVTGQKNKPVTDGVLYLGRPTADITSKSEYGSARIDEFEIHSANRNHMITFNLLENDSPSGSTTVQPVWPADDSYRFHFDGHNWFYFDGRELNPNYLDKSNNETLRLRFRTEQPNGLIWYNGVPDKNMHLTLKDGILYLIIKDGESQDVFKIPDYRFDDNKWHNVIINQHNNEISMLVDHQSFRHYTDKNVKMIRPSDIYIGGSESPGTHTNKHINNNFKGYISQAILTGDNYPYPIDFFQQYLNKVTYIKNHNHVTFINSTYDEYTNIIDVPSEDDRPVTFTNQKTYLYLPKWENPKSLEFHFKTRNPNGLILFQEGYPKSFSIELYDGVPYVNYGQEKYTFDRPAGITRYNDNKAHKIRVEFDDDNKLNLYLDNRKKISDLPTGDEKSNAFDGYMFVGGVDQRNRLPWQIWNKNDNNYTGCLWGFRLNGPNPVDLSQPLYRVTVDGILSGCQTFELECKVSHCENGACLDTWNGYKCDCSNTHFSGDHCERFAPIGSFGSNDHIKLNYHDTLKSHMNDFSLRFKTDKSDGLLFETVNKHNDQYIKMFLEDGEARVDTYLGGKKTIFSIVCNDLLHDNQWHTATVKRRANHLEVSVEDCETKIIKLPGSGYNLEIDSIHIGRESDYMASTIHPFNGEMQNIIIDDVNVLDSISSNTKITNVDIDSTLVIRSSDLDLINPVTFRKHSESFLHVNPPMLIPDQQFLDFNFKTSDANGLILFADGSTDRLIFELVDGRFRASLNDHSSESTKTYSDQKTHRVKVTPVNGYLTVTIDDERQDGNKLFLNNVNGLNADNVLYVGGVPKNFALPDIVKSKNKGYTGCISSFSLNENYFDLMKNSKEPSSYVTAGCTDTSTFCSPQTCQHRGVCTETEDNFHCNCAQTSFVGHYCEAESEGYRFGANGKPGIVVYKIAPAATTEKDELAFGFMTWKENGTIVRIDGTKDDFIHAKLENGNLAFAYDIGEGENKVVESRKTLNDGRYHYASFVRNGGSAVVRVDQMPARKVQGGSTGAFDNMNVVKVGGDLDESRNIIHPFNGIIAGVHLNSQHLIADGLSGKQKFNSKGSFYQASHPFRLEHSSTDESDEETINENEWHGGGASWGDDGDAQTGQLQGGPPGAGVFTDGPRAAAIAGAMLGVLLLLSSIMWAVYKFKPGLMTGAYSKINTNEPGGIVGAGAGADSDVMGSYKIHDCASSGPFTSKVGAMLNESEQTTANSGAVHFSNASAVDGSVHFTNTGAQMGYNTGGQTMQSQVGAGMNIYDTAGSFNTMQQTSNVNYDTNYSGNVAFNAANANATFGRQVSPPPFIFPDGGQYQMRNMALNQSTLYNQQEVVQQQYITQQQQSLLPPPPQQHYSTSSSNVFQQQGLPNLMSNEEVRVDCVQLTTNGRYVVTGSIQGPPQVWDMKSGELIRVMQGDDLNSTDLHLANGDSYLVGQVADQSQAPYTRTNTYTPVPHATSYRKLQIWDFNSGKPLEMKSNEFCTASCMMNDGERMIIGRTEKLGQGTTVVIWDILANEPIRHIFWPGFVGSFDDPLTYINLSKDNRYIIAGAQNSSDGTANYVMFDLTTTDFDRMPPNVISINANVETTTILENQEAVTGTRSGDLVIWSLKTGKALRQLAAPSATNLAESAHQGEVTCVCLSKDGQYLVSSSTDGSLKIWNMEQEKLQRTLIGHRDEVWCCTISNDNELVVSGSRDQTIRLWRVEDGGLMASIQTGIDIFRVMLSNNKKTVVALADKFGARKLVMLQVVRTKIKSSGGGSRATSPMSTLATSDVNYRF